MKKKLVIIGMITATAILLLAACSQTEGDGEQQVEVFEHVHGISFDLQAPYDLYLSTHHGLIRMDKEGDWQWTSTSDHRHDLMSFTIQNKETMISSGHPAKTSKLKNPIGVVISKDKGATWEPIALHGEVDFHVMDVNAGDSKVIYGITTGKQGIFRSQDGGYNWEVMEAHGLPVTDRGELSVYSLVSNPGNPTAVLAGTGQGIFTSLDGGETWTLANNEQTFVSGKGMKHPSEKIIAYVVGKSEGLMLSEDFGETWTLLNLALENDAVAHIAYHPSEEGRYVVGTSKENLYQTNDGGNSWTKLAESGKPIK